MSLFLPQQQAPIAGDPQIHALSFDSLQAAFKAMLQELQGAATRITGSEQLVARAKSLEISIQDVLDQLEANKGGDPRLVLSFDLQRRQLRAQLDQFFYEVGGPGYAVTLQGTSSDPSKKYLWLGAGAFAIAIGAIAYGIYASKPKRRGRSLGSILKPKFKRAIPAR